MLINIQEDVLKDFLSKHSLEVVFVDMMNNEIKRQMVRDFLPSFFLDSPQQQKLIFSPCNIEFRRENDTARIERLGVVTINYRMITKY